MKTQPVEVGVPSLQRRGAQSPPAVPGAELTPPGLSRSGPAASSRTAGQEEPPAPRVETEQGAKGEGFVKFFCFALLSLSALRQLS